MKYLNRAALYVLPLAFLVSACSSKKEAPAVDPNTTLSGAVARGDLEQVQKLLAQGADPNENLGTENHALTPLLIAVALEKADIARVLIKKGAQPSPLHLGYSAQDLALYLDQDLVASAMEGH